MEITKCDYNSLKYAQRNRDDDRYRNHGKEMCKLYLFSHCFHICHFIYIVSES